LLDRLDGIDSHLSDRVAGRHELRYFPSNGVDWLGLLKAFAKECQGFFDMSFIMSRDGEEAKRLHDATIGNLRRLKRLLTEAVLVAVDAGRRSLDAGVMSTAFTAVHGVHGNFANPYAR
jgi:hypothetical protein